MTQQMQSGTRLTAERLVRAIFVTVVLVLCCCVIAYGLVDHYRHNKVSFVALNLVIFSGVLVFILRQKMRFVYGLIEFMLGCLITANGSVELPVREFFSGSLTVNNLAMNTNWVSLISGIYFIVRGMDNIGKGLKASRARAVMFNTYIDSNMEKLTEVEAKKIWIKNGMPGNTASADWHKAERRVLARKSSTDLADSWGKWLGFD